MKFPWWRECKFTEVSQRLGKKPNTVCCKLLHLRCYKIGLRCVFLWEKISFVCVCVCLSWILYKQAQPNSESCFDACMRACYSLQKKVFSELFGICWLENLHLIFSGFPKQGITVISPISHYIPSTLTVALLCCWRSNRSTNCAFRRWVYWWTWYTTAASSWLWMWTWCLGSQPICTWKSASW